MSAHAWEVTPKDAIELQKQLAMDVQLSPLAAAPSLIAGCDVSMNRFAKEGFAGFVTMMYPNLEIRETAATVGVIPFPYVPGLLSFREIPMLLTAWEKLEQKPELIVVDGVGIAHPRRLGIASHLGLVLGVPTIGVAKSILVGAYENLGDEPGATAPLIDRRTGETIGMALRTKARVAPVFVSPGHLVTLMEAARIVASTARKHRIPEPTRQAHLAVNAARVAYQVQ